MVRKVLGDSHFRPPLLFTHSVIVRLYVFPWCRWRWLCPWRLLEWMLCVDQPSGGCWIFRSAGIIFVLLILTLQCSSLFYVQHGTMVLFLGVQMKLLPIVFTNNNSSTPFHHFLLPPTFHPLCLSLHPPPWWVQLFSKLWLHGGWIWFIFAHRPFRACLGSIEMNCV